MMTNTIQRADTISRTRARMMPILAIVLMTQQILFISWDGRAVTAVQTIAWALLVLILTLTLVTGGAWFQSREVRDLANDEVTQANRAIAIRRGFIAAIVVAVMVFVISPFQPLTVQRAVHLIVTTGLTLALLSFGLLERKSLG